VAVFGIHLSKVSSIICSRVYSFHPHTVLVGSTDTSRQLVNCSVMVIVRLVASVLEASTLRIIVFIADSQRAATEAFHTSLRFHRILHYLICAASFRTGIRFGWRLFHRLRCIAALFLIFGRLGFTGTARAAAFCTGHAGLSFRHLYLTALYRRGYIRSAAAFGARGGTIALVVTVRTTITNKPDDIGSASSLPLLNILFHLHCEDMCLWLALGE